MPSENDEQRPDFSAITPEPQDLRGSYGFGRPAHKADPEGSYGCEPKSKILPPKFKRDAKTR